MVERTEKNIIYHTDNGGHTIELQEYQGSFYPAPVEFEVIKNYQFRDIRPNDVVLSNYPKSGTHWFWEIISQLMAGKAENMRSIWKGDRMLEVTSQAVLDAAPSPRILNTHVLFEQLPRGVVEKKCKIVHVLRNPKDVAVSYYNHHRDLKYMYKYEGLWKDYLPMFCKGHVDWGAWFDNTKSYLKAKEQYPELPIHITFYEDMIEDPVLRVKELAEFLGVDASDELCRGITAKCQFENMKAVAKETGKGLLQDGVAKVFRKGGVGDWKNWFTISQNEEFDRLYNEKMVGYDIPFKYTVGKNSVPSSVNNKTS